MTGRAEGGTEFGHAGRVPAARARPVRGDTTPPAPFGEGRGAGADVGAGVGGTDIGAGGKPGSGSGDGPRWRPNRQRILAGTLVVLALMVAAGTWIVVRGLLARSHLEAARTQITRLRDEIAAGTVPDGERLRRITEEIAARTEAARSMTSDPVWSLAGHVPVAGCPLRSSTSLAKALDDVATGTLAPVVELGRTLDPSSLRSGTSINVTALAAARVPAERVGTALASFAAATRRAPTCGWLGREVGLDVARDEAVATGDRLRGAVDTLALAARLGPDLLGASGPRRYLLVVQNPAESRANGGIVGGFGLLTATDGRLELAGISGNGNLPGGPTHSRPAVPLTRELAARYGSFWPNRIWANANLVPDYPTTGRLYSALYRAGTGTRVDGTISLDPTTLAYLLAPTGPAVLPDGRVVKASELVELVESRAYEEIADVPARDRFFAEVGEAVYEAVVTGGDAPGDTAKLLKALARAAEEGRLQVSSNHAAEQRVLSGTALGGALLDVPGPFLGVVTQNAAASKLDYWLRRGTEYHMRRQPDGSGQATITVTLTNAAPAGLSDYVRNRSDVDRPGWTNDEAQNNLWFSLYTGVGSGLVDASLDGEPIAMAVGEEKGRPVLSTYLTVDRGQTRTLRFRVLERTAGPVLTLRSQPLTFPEKLVVEGLPAEPIWLRRVTK